MDASCAVGRHLPCNVDTCSKNGKHVSRLGRVNRVTPRSQHAFRVRMSLETGVPAAAIRPFLVSDVLDTTGCLVALPCCAATATNGRRIDVMGCMIACSTAGSAQRLQNLRLHEDGACRSAVQLADGAEPLPLARCQRQRSTQRSTGAASLHAVCHSVHAAKHFRRRRRSCLCVRFLRFIRFAEL